MMKKAISFGIVCLFVISGLIGIFLVVPDEVEGPGPTDISGLITANTTWTSDNSPYHIIGDTTLMNGYTLTIEPGVVVKFTNNTQLSIRGDINVSGNSGNRVIFTALPPMYDYSLSYLDSNGYGGWINYNGTGVNYKIYVDEANGGTANISYAKIEHSADWAMHIDGFQYKSVILDTIFVNNKNALAGCPVEIGRSEFRDNYVAIDAGNFLLYESVFEYNIYGLGGCGNFIANNCTFNENIYGILGGSAEIKHTTSSNNRVGVKLSTSDIFLVENSIYNNQYGLILENGNPPSETIELNNILNNSLYNALMEFSFDIDAPNNWWGTTNTMIIDQYIYDIYDDLSLGELLYVPILVNPSPNAPEIPGGSGLQSGAPWPMFRGNVRHTGLSPYDTSGNPGELIWDYFTSFQITSNPAISADGVIYIGAWGLYAIYPNGTEKWFYSTPSAPVGVIESSPAIDINGTIYFGCNDNNLYAINPNGTEKWIFPINGQVRFSSPAIGSDGTIYIGSYDNNLTAINPNGTEKWRFMTGDDIDSSPAIDSNGIIYIGSNDGKLYAVYPNGTQKWNFPTGDIVFASPVIGADGTIYIPSLDHQLYAIYPNGTKKWNFTASGEFYSTPAIIPDGTIYVGCNDGNLYAINPDGTEKWKFYAADTFYSSPVVGSDGTIFAGTGTSNKLYALNPDGTQKWEITLGNWIYHSSPAIGSDGTIYFGDTSGCLQAIGENDQNQSPIVPPPPSGPTSGQTNTTYSFSTSTTDPEGNKIKYGWDWDGDGTVDEWSGLVDSGVEDNRSHSWSEPGIFSIKVKVKDGYNADSGWSNVTNITITSPSSNQPPLTPPTPTGPTSGLTNTSYTFNTSTIDPEGDQIKYGWDWDGDGTVDEWSGLVDSGIVESRSHNWSLPDIFSIKVKAQDEYGAESGWSSILVINISNPPIPPVNQPPITPSYPSGPGSGEINTSYSFYIATIDMDHDKIKYGWDWDGDGIVDEWSDFVLYLVDDMRSHTWSEPGIYNISVKVQDEHGAESGWSGLLTITITIEPDFDGDGIPDSEDPDDDNDGHIDTEDHFPFDPTRWDPLTEISILNITVSNESPIEGDEITINVDIQNSDISNNNIIVKFYHGNPNLGGTQIGPSQEVTIGSESLISISQNWIATSGNQTLYVVIGHNETTETITSSITIEVSEELISQLVLSVGDINMYRFEPGEERTIFVEVTCYYQTLENVHLVVLDDQNLTIDHTITPPRTMLDGETTKFYMRITAPQLPDGTEKLEWDITIQAVGEGGISSNSEELDIIVSQNAVSFFNPVILAGAVATGSLATLGLAAAASRRNENWKYLLLLSLAVPLYTRIHGKKTLDNFVRGQVFGHIQSEPGTHFNEIKKTLQLGNGNLAYHLQKLEKEGFVKSKRDKRYRRFYPVGVVVPEEDGIKLSKTQETMLDHIERHPHSTQKEIAENLKESQQTISYNINVLVREGFMQEEKIKGIKKYTLIDENS